MPRTCRRTRSRCSTRPTRSRCRSPRWPAWCATCTPDTARMREMAGSGFATATDLADWLVRVLRLPFRTAHHVTGRLVARAEARGVDLAGLTLAEMQAEEPRHHRGRVRRAHGGRLGRQPHQLSAAPRRPTSPPRRRAGRRRWREDRPRCCSPWPCSPPAARRARRARPARRARSSTPTPTRRDEPCPQPSTTTPTRPPPS